MFNYVIIQINVIMAIVVLNISISVHSNNNKDVWIKIKSNMLNNIIILQVVCLEELYYNILITIQMAHFQ
jgi:hypothetical protein